MNHLLPDPQFLARVGAMILGVGWVWLGPGTERLCHAARGARR